MLRIPSSPLGGGVRPKWPSSEKSPIPRDREVTSAEVTGMEDELSAAVEVVEFHGATRDKNWWRQHRPVLAKKKPGSIEPPKRPG
jgi:hypothetical protein